MRKDNQHTLLVAPYEQSRETHFALSRMIWKAVEGFIEHYKAYRLHKAQQKLYRQLADYPEYILKDLGFNPEETRQIQFYSNRPRQQVGWLAGTRR
ncbi:hypothetical protein [Enterovibrio paralichthyis]|uniref:hypothetical protein n=1 Tax=Enterovibrio paralichthyis TaxID=2853805 RepID=UPI001C44B3BA|nr:hypothetical protein [Enterovibrio paralichthyis]MBV7298062.1 hypothetical protein [Enterovibrio paralichthyis]